MVFVLYPNDVIYKYCIDCFLYVESHLYSWDRSHLVMVQAPFYVLPCSFFLSSVQEVTTFYGVFAVRRMWVYGQDTSSLYFWLEKSVGVF